MIDSTAGRPVLSRRQAVAAGLATASAAIGVGRDAGTVLAQDGTPPAATPTGTTAATRRLPDAAQAIMDQAKYSFSRWGLFVADRETGEPLYAMREDERFLGASTTKLFTTTSALHWLGADHTFTTQVYRTGDVTDGVLAGDLVIVASGDPTLGGRNTPEGTIAYTEFDHIYANVADLAVLTPEDPLAGITELAEQVAAAGVSRVAGDVIVDDRLFPTFIIDDYVMSPVWVNDNLIDITITPGGGPDEPATINWRPESAAFTVVSSVQTTVAGGTTSLTLSTPAADAIAVTGTVAADSKPIVRVSQVPDPAALLRTVLIEALARAGVSVAAASIGANPVAGLPEAATYSDETRIAAHTSLPFSENVRLINKVSHNQHADLCVMLMALANGETSFEAGMPRIAAFLEVLGLDPVLVSLADGRGNRYSDLFSPRTINELLRLMTTQDDFAVLMDSLPIFGVDGSETTLVPSTSPIAGKAAGKSGTTVDANLLVPETLLMTRGLAGYMTGASGREVTFAIYVMDVPMADFNALFPIMSEQGEIMAQLYAEL